MLITTQWTNVLWSYLGNIKVLGHTYNTFQWRFHSVNGLTLTEGLMCMVIPIDHFEQDNWPISMLICTWFVRCQSKYPHGAIKQGSFEDKNQRFQLQLSEVKRLHKRIAIIKLSDCPIPGIQANGLMSA